MTPPPVVNYKGKRYIRLASTQTVEMNNATVHLDKKAAKWKIATVKAALRKVRCRAPVSAHVLMPDDLQSDPTKAMHRVLYALGVQYWANSLDKEQVKGWNVLVGKDPEKQGKGMSGFAESFADYWLGTLKGWRKEFMQAYVEKDTQPLSQRENPTNLQKRYNPTQFAPPMQMTDEW